MTSGFSRLDLTQAHRHSPIAIQFVKPILKNVESEDNSPIFDTGFRLGIKSPVSNGIGYKHSYPAGFEYFEVPNTGILKLRLLPSDRYTPRGRYTVRYFKPGVTRHVHEETWIVPSIVFTKTLTMTHDSSLPGDPFPNDEFGVFEINNIGHEGEYVIYQNTIRWTSNPPADGQQYKVDYVPALTLKHLREETHDQVERGWIH